VSDQDLSALVVRGSFSSRDLWKKILYSGFELIGELLRTTLTHKKNLLLDICCFCLFGEFAEVLERKIRRVQLAYSVRDAALALFTESVFSITNKS